MQRKQQLDAFAYLRVEPPGQVRGDRFGRQRQAIHRYAKAHELRLAGEYLDEGVSGAAGLADRPGLAALLAAAMASDVRMVLVEHPHRIGADMVVSEIIFATFRKAGVTVLSAKDGADLTDSEDPDRALVRQVLGTVKAADKSQLVRRLRKARDAKRKQVGRCEGRLPFGTGPGEAETVERMIALRLTVARRRPLSFARIAAVLNEEGRATRTGVPWRPGGVFAVLKRIRATRATVGP